MRSALNAIMGFFNRFMAMFRSGTNETSKENAEPSAPLISSDGQLTPSGKARSLSLSHEQNKSDSTTSEALTPLHQKQEFR